ncbi:MAG: 2OG-Fe(II) oxygenase [Methylophilaceae bacterium]|nr:2OG-Fe(II) oxygenase [Methylophilaceae bacterium]
MSPTHQHIRQIIENIQQQGYAIVDDFMETGATQALADQARALKSTGVMHKATTGLSKTQSELRGDFIHWIEASAASPSEQVYLDAMAELQQALNQAFFLGLFELESHFAIYPAGAGYHKHLDQFVGKEERKISCILYLNDDWQDTDGGQLRIYLDKQDLDKQNQAHFFDVLPTGGKLVVFVSSDFIHEVLPAKRERIAITGWFRTRSDAI